MICAIDTLGVPPFFEALQVVSVDFDFVVAAVAEAVGISSLILDSSGLTT